MFTIGIQVVDAKVVLDRKGKDGASSKISECIVGDATGTIVFKARNEQGEFVTTCENPLQCPVDKVPCV